MLRFWHCVVASVFFAGGTARAAIAPFGGCGSVEAKAAVISYLGKAENVPKVPNAVRVISTPTRLLQVGHNGVTIDEKDITQTLGGVSLPAHIGGPLEATMLGGKYTATAFDVVLCGYARPTTVKSWSDITTTTLAAVAEKKTTFISGTAFHGANPYSRAVVGDVDDAKYSEYRVAAAFFTAKDDDISLFGVKKGAPKALSAKVTLAPEGQYLLTPTGLEATPLPPPSADDCIAKLRAKSIPFRAISQKLRGIVEPVMLTGKIQGVSIVNAYSTTLDPNKILQAPMACDFANEGIPALVSTMIKHGFTMLASQGSYCYRYINNGKNPKEMLECGMPAIPTPDPKLLSNHSFGRALDIKTLYKATATGWDPYDLQTDFVRTGKSYILNSATCGTGAAAQTGKSKELYDFYCEASLVPPFVTRIGPNSNAQHRDHIHLDMGDGRDESH